MDTGGHQWTPVDTSGVTVGWNFNLEEFESSKDIHFNEETLIITLIIAVVILVFVNSH